MIKKADILKTLEAKDNADRTAYGTAWTFRTDYHTIDSYEVKELLENLDEEEYEDADAIYDELTYDGELYEYAETACPIYYHDIAKWFGENWGAVNDYIDEFGDMAKDGEGKGDIMKTIQGAYCMTYERELWEAVKAIIDETEEANA